MKNLKLTTLALLIFLASCAPSKKVTISTIEGGRISVDGKKVAGQSVDLKIPKNSTVRVEVEKDGFVPIIREYVDNKTVDIPRRDFIELELDEAWQNSVTTDIANRGINIPTNPKMSEEDVWITLNQVVLDPYFDVIETSDQKTGYLRTAWSLDKFNYRLCRTRLIVKYVGQNPLTYKVELQSEWAPSYVKSSEDENFIKWERVLRKYDAIIDDLRSRLSK